MVGCWRGYLSGVKCKFASGPDDAHCHPDWFLPFWYHLTHVVVNKRPLNGCVCVLVSP